MMKTLATLLFFACLPCFAQDPATTHAYAAACGPVDAKLDAALSKPPAPPAPPEGKALVYFLQADDQTNAFCLTKKCGGADVRLGIDGAWVGVTSGKSYVAVPVDAGRHHLCANWQSHFKKLSHHEVYLQPLAAESGHVYYFRVHVSQGNGGGEAAVPFSLSLEPVNEDEANMLLEVEPQSQLRK